jgi:hypothetical protein
MARPFSIHTVLRMTPNHLLQEFLLRLGLGDLGLQWDELKERNIGPILEALRALPHRLFDQIEAASCCGVERPADELPPDGSVYHKAMWAWLHRRQAFNKALLIHHVDQLAWWRKRDDLPARAPNTSSEA